MNSPTIRYAEHLQNWEEHTEVNGKWFLARPLGFQGLDLFWRIKCAWMVFTGEADVLLWMQNKPPTEQEKSE